MSDYPQDRILEELKKLYQLTSKVVEKIEQLNTVTKKLEVEIEKIKTDHTSLLLQINTIQQHNEQIEVLRHKIEIQDKEIRDFELKLNNITSVVKQNNYNWENVFNALFKVSITVIGAAITYWLFGRV